MTDEQPLVLTPQSIGRGQRDTSAADPLGRLAGTLLSVAIAGAADNQRFRRGKEYAATGAVERLEVSSGMLRATVIGSRSEAYTVTVAVPTVAAVPDGRRPERADITRLSPTERDLLSTCTCPDWESPCKHAVAALLTLSAEIAAKPDVLVRWRTGGASASRRVAVGSRAASVAERALAGRNTAPVDPFDTPAWHAFLGAPPQLDAAPSTEVRTPSDAPVVGQAVLDRADVGSVVRSAHRALRRWGGHDDPRR